MVLLVAVMQVAVPVHGIFHHHTESDHDTHHEQEFHKYEKPCCKPTNYFHKNAVIFKQQCFIFSGIVYTPHIFDYRGNYSRSIFSVSNKAPPATTFPEVI